MQLIEWKDLSVYEMTYYTLSRLLNNAYLLKLKTAMIMITHLFARQSQTRCLLKMDLIFTTDILTGSYRWRSITCNIKWKMINPQKCI